MRHYKKWFDKNGWILRSLPKRAAADCIHPGSCDGDISDFREAIGFNIPPELHEKARAYLREYGAWDEEELKAMDSERLESTILWLACGDIEDGQSFDGLNR